jgi:hypothetical protein
MRQVLAAASRPEGIDELERYRVVESAEEIALIPADMIQERLCLG